MDFTIISLGNVEFLSMVLNGVAMICGTGNYTRLVAVGFVIGLLYIGFQCIFEGAQKINLHHTFLCFLCFLCMFGPSCTCVVEDAYTGKVRTVDNLPLGVGVAGAAISGIGYGVTRMLEQGFGTYDRTSEHQFAEPLRILNKVRSVAQSEQLFQAINNELGTRANGAPSDSKQAIINYLSECTMAKIQLGEVSPTQLYNSTWDSEAFKFSSDAHTVLLPIGGMGTNEVVTCNAGYAKLNTIFQKFSSTSVKTAINQFLHLKNDDGTTIATNMDKVDNAMQALNATMNGSQDYMQMVVLEGVYKQAAIKFYGSQQDTASAIAVNQGIMQRNTQWAAEGTMFLSASRALMAFFEGFIYAITPIMGFLIAIGSFGIGLVGKYFLTIAWIQLWLPILSILNLYIMTGARSAITDANLGIGASFYAIDTLWSETATWVATGGMLTAATPMLALFLVSGSTFAFTSLAGRLNGQDHFNERIATPDAVSPSAVMSHAPHFQGDRVGGVRVHGSDGAVSKVSMSNMFDSLESSARATVNAASKNLSSTITENYMSGKSTQGVQQHLESLGRTLGSTKVDGNSTLENHLSKSTFTEGMSSEQLRQATGAAAMIISGDAKLEAGAKVGAFKDKEGNVQVKGGFPGRVLAAMGIGAEASANGETKLTYTGTSTDSFSDKNSSSRQYGRDHSASKSKSMAANLSNAYQTATNDFTSKTWTDLSNASQGTAVAEAANKLISATQTYQNIDTARNSFGGKQEMTTTALAEQLLGTSVGKELANFERTAEGRSAGIPAAAQKYASMYGGNLEKGKIAAALDYITTSGDMGSQLKLADALANANIPTLGITPQNASMLRDTLQRPGDVDQDVANARKTIQDNTSTIHDDKHAPISFNKAQEAVRTDNQEKSSQVDTQARINQNKPFTDAQKEAIKLLETKHGASTMTQIANNWLRDGAVDSFVKGVVDPFLKQEDRYGRAPNEPGRKDTGHLHEGGEQTVGAMVNNVAHSVGQALAPEHSQTIRHLSEAQGNYLKAYHYYQANPTEENARKLDSAFIGVRNEMMSVMNPGTKPEDMTKEAHRNVAKATIGMVNQLQQINDFDNQAAANHVTRFNTLFGVREKP